MLNYIILKENKDGLNTELLPPLIKDVSLVDFDELDLDTMICDPLWQSEKISKYSFRVVIPL
jgi:hypothetical protein